MAATHPGSLRALLDPGEVTQGVAGRAAYPQCSHPSRPGCGGRALRNGSVGPGWSSRGLLPKGLGYASDRRLGLYWMARRTSRARSMSASRATRCRAMSMPALDPCARDQVAVVDEAGVDVGDDGGIELGEQVASRPTVRPWSAPSRGPRRTHCVTVPAETVWTDHQPWLAVPPSAPDGWRCFQAAHVESHGVPDAPRSARRCRCATSRPWARSRPTTSTSSWCTPDRPRGRPNRCCDHLAGGHRVLRRGRHCSEGTVELAQTGPFGYTVRVLPKHNLLARPPSWAWSRSPDRDGSPPIEGSRGAGLRSRRRSAAVPGFRPGHRSSRRYRRPEGLP